MARNFQQAPSCLIQAKALRKTGSDRSPLNMVPKAGLEPARLAPLPPQDSVSTNSTTSA